MQDAVQAAWTERGREVVFETPYFAIERRQLRPPGGAELDYFVHDAPDSALCVCVNDHREVLLEWQYRPAIGRVSVDYPAGRIEPDDANPAAAVLRELEEETGYRASSVRNLGIVDKDPGFSGSRMHLFLVEGLTAGEHRPDESERIATRFVPETEVWELIASGQLSCAYCLSATLLAFRAAGWLAPTVG